MIKVLHFAFAGLVCCLMATIAKAQNLPVGAVGIEDYYRREQLTGKMDSSVSFTVRPLSPVQQFNIKSAYNLSGGVYKPGKNHEDISWILGGSTNNFTGMLLPVTLQTQYNSDHPYGWNDGPMIPAKGLQTYLSAGLYVKYGPLSIQLQPEFVSAANQNFDDFNKAHYDITVAHYYDFYNFIDLPTRFGNEAYNKAFWGQSSIRLNFNNISFGVSTENLWWGPGIRNSLIMSNDAPGFKHFTLNTIKSIKTPIGSFEGQIIAGTLENSNYAPLTPDRLLFGSDLYVPKMNLPRHISGFVFTWQPKWVSGLFLGVTRSSQLYKKDVKGIGDYLPFSTGTASTLADQPAFKKNDYRGSIFARWLWPSERAEVYFEYGINHNSSDQQQIALGPQDSRAYTVGLRKMIEFNSARNENLLFSIEGTELGQTSLKNILDIQSWYLNKYIRQGYTNLGQSLGAGIGPGGNLQSIDVSWVKGIKRLGIQIERYLHNDDFYYYAYSGTQDFRRHWVDLSVATSGEWNYKNLIFNAKLQYIFSQNYQYYLDPSKESPNTYYVNGVSANNIQLRAGVTYRF